MAKKTLLTEGATFHKVKSGFITEGGVYRKIKKAFVTDGGVYRPCWGGGVADMSIVLPAGATDNGVVTMSGVQYRLLTITKTGTIGFSEPVVGEVWMCGGGTSGRRTDVINQAGGGGAGAFTATGTVTLTGDMTAVVGAGGAAKTSGTHQNFGGASSFAGLQTSTAFAADSSVKYHGVSGGTGGGAAQSNTLGKAGTGDGKSKYPFGDSVYFANCPCAGGGGGGQKNKSEHYAGGSGGSNGGGGYNAGVGNARGGAGGSYGGGEGGWGQGGNINGQAATFYGGGGGGAAGDRVGERIGESGAGYQGVIYIRIPVIQ